jgi:PAS domain S-box-containing protein
MCGKHDADDSHSVDPGEDDETLSGTKAEAILESAWDILENRGFSELAPRIFLSCKNLVGATAGYVALLSKDGHENEVVYLDPGDLACQVDPELPMPIRGFREIVYRLGEAQYCNDFSNRDWADLMPPGHVHLENVLFSPLNIQGETVGLIGLANKPGGFTEGDLEIATDFGRLAALALKNSRARDLLEESEERYRSLAQTANDAVILTLEEGTITFWNRGAERMFDELSGDMIGKNIISMVCSDPEVYRERMKIVMGGDLSKEPLEVMMSTGKWEVPVEVVISHSRTEGGFFTHIIRDITERRNSDMAMEMANRKLHLLGSATRHDILNQVMIITGYEGMIEESLEDPTIRSYLVKLREAVDRITRLLDFQRDYENMGTRRPEWVRVNDIVSVAASKLDMGEINLTVEAEDVEILADPLIEKVFYNLLHNTIEHARGTTECRVGMEGDHSPILFYEDNGPGIPDENKGRIFEYGFGEGTGHGFFLCSEILSLNEMTIREVGTHGEGVRFEITMPVSHHRTAKGGGGSVIIS